MTTTQERIVALNAGAFDCMLSDLPQVSAESIDEVLDYIETALNDPDSDVAQVFLFPSVLLSLAMLANDSEFSVVSYQHIFAFNNRVLKLLNRTQERIFEEP